MDTQAMMEFLHTAEKLKCRTRHCTDSNGEAETVAEHSWRTALMALLLCPQQPQLDGARVAAMCLVHDLGEAVTGDIPTFLKTDADEHTESDAISALLDTLPDSREQLKSLFAEMDALSTPEARFFKALDKLEAVIQHNESDIATWLPLERELNLTYGEKECAEFSPLAALRAAARAETEQKL